MSGLGTHPWLSNDVWTGLRVTWPHRGLLGWLRQVLVGLILDAVPPLPEQHNSTKAGSEKTAPSPHMSVCHEGRQSVVPMSWLSVPVFAQVVQAGECLVAAVTGVHGHGGLHHGQPRVTGRRRTQRGAPPKAPDHQAKGRGLSQRRGAKKGATVRAGGVGRASTGTGGRWSRGKQPARLLRSPSTSSRMQQCLALWPLCVSHPSMSPFSSSSVASPCPPVAWCQRSSSTPSTSSTPLALSRRYTHHSPAAGRHDHTHQ